jgi:ubiquitin C-terminal hydrolase
LDLTQHFLNNGFKNDINTSNPLGLNGELATSYGYLMKKMWFDGDKEIAPFAFKSALGRFNNMFQGNNLHDS